MPRTNPEDLAMTILHIDSSILGEGSVSRPLTAAITEALAAESGARVVYRDLADDDGTWPGGGDALDAFLEADTVVIGAPMYNFGVPHQLKAWIDSIAVAGRTFRYTEAGPVGLAGGKRVIVAYSSGGFHREDDFVEPYLRRVFGLFGIDDITVVRAEGVNVTPEIRQQAIEQAMAQIPTLLDQAA
jgi:FMN-dependent NADH-azoreductase